MVFGEYYGKQAWRVPIRMVRTARWKYVRYLSYGEELYDLAADPGELRNLVREPSAASERTRLARELDDWIRRYRAIRSPDSPRRIGREGVRP